MNRLSIDTLWTPADISTFAWYDASDASTITESGGNVSQWDDKSGNSRHLIQLSGSIQPNWGLGDQINGMNIMYYQGTFDQMRANFADTDVTQVAVVTIAEAKTSGDWPSLGLIQSTDTLDKFNMRGQCNATQGRINSGITLDGSTTSMITAYDANFAEEVPVLTSHWYDGADAVARINGGVTSITKDVADGATFSVGRVQVGREFNTPKNYQAEFVILDTADLATIQKAEGYLAWKWGTVANLDISHPYKNVRPTV